MENDKRIIRCAIYCRKSVEKGLDMEFDSLDAQREAAEAYVTSQKANGWVCLPEHYDDGGFSGGDCFSGFLTDFHGFSTDFRGFHLAP